ncbi:MAG: urate hydroxylase PuuD [Gammaproteobacteria bacterium]|nr:urate hydroxylase PuuD [Gammaproteobacteria bacterium]MDH3750383.1 urate hydroxylase PuuD [Gammaproteobacteria bacterium]MDH3803903.1 urate hydroxylase PuuD [Gammaproteobacteria bacterium]
MNPLKSVAGTIIGGVVLAVILVLVSKGNHLVFAPVANSLIIWLHVLAGITWIGLLYYFNFVQVPALGDAAADEGGPGGAGITKYVAPRALWWFRWGALVTWLTGASYLAHTGQLDDAFALGMLTDPINSYALTIGIGAWLGTFMLFNVWILIWPAQKKILGMVEASAEQIAKARNVAFMASRSNTLMSIPMVMSMVGAHHGFVM